MLFLTLITAAQLRADPPAQNQPQAATSEAATSPASEAASNNVDPGPPEKDDGQTQSNNLLLAIIAYGMRHAKR